MDDAALSAFGQHAEDWERYTRAPLGRLRQELVLHHLGQHLRERRPELTALDAGAGTGGYALPLVRQGYHVVLVDFSPQMLNIARSQIAAADSTLLQRAEFLCMRVEEVAGRLPSQHFDLILAHTLFEYVERPWEALRMLIALLAPEGLLSVLLANPRADALHWAWAKGDLGRALRALRAPVSQADLFGLPRRTLALDQVRDTIRDEGLREEGCYGVRVFADYLPSSTLVDEGGYARLWELELAASAMEPYRSIARYMHLLAGKPLRER
jgi:S-adenosylmethionine-dependent methyltransferase